MADRKSTLREKWYWFNGAWQVDGENEEHIPIYRTIKWRNLPRRIIQFVWEEWIAVKICKRYGHKWEPCEDQSFSYCTRCGVDTDITCYY